MNVPSITNAGICIEIVGIALNKYHGWVRLVKELWVAMRDWVKIWYSPEVIGIWSWPMDVLVQLGTAP